MANSAVAVGKSVFLVTMVSTKRLAAVLLSFALSMLPRVACLAEVWLSVRGRASTCRPNFASSWLC